ncbi:melanoma-associated antigen B3 [Phodopus roborovskii]|uniref:Mageb5 protein n=1 Tax=Phodopus roborovskii TaxID=109678 RepID=A0AAU9Z028_PHORO|nr:melanoma-associated antigen B3 [Phodopus roborovskii]CAH6780284.1 Mageb5 [Phodopus roborovskii]
MPRGQKSKLHAWEKHHQARGEAQAYGGAWETTEETPEAEGESSAAYHSQPGAESSSTPKAGTQKATPSASTPLSISSSESDESSSEESDKYEERECPFEDKPCTIVLHRDLIARKVVLLLQYLLHNYNLKQLTTKEEMLKVITKKYEKDFPEILRKASEKLDEIFAVEVREVNSSEPSYNLISKLKLPNNGRIRAGKGLPKTGFLMSVLGIIYIRGNCASEEDIWEILKKKQIYPGKKHRIFGEPRKLMTQYLVKLKYLEYRQVADSDPPRYEFLWGPQAHAEISKMKVLEFLAKINKTTPSAISALYEEAVKEEQEGAEARDEDDSDATDKAGKDSPVKSPANSTIPDDS